MLLEPLNEITYLRNSMPSSLTEAVSVYCYIDKITLDILFNLSLKAFRNQVVVDHIFWEINKNKQIRRGSGV